MRILGICALAALMATPACKKKDEGHEPGKGNVGQKPLPVKKLVVTRKQADPAQVARGKYLVGLAGCLQCHTPFTNGMPDMKRLGAGGFEMEEVPFGTWRSTNITPDKKTGIGSWSDAEVMAAIRQGKRKDGTMIAPIMPYVFYNKLTDADAKAMVVFLRTLPAVANQVASSNFKMPRPPGPIPVVKASVDMTDPLQRGGYLAGVMHCVSCHTPMTKMGPDMKMAFAGGFPMKIPEKFSAMMGKGVLHSSNITSDNQTGIGTWTEQDIINSFTKFIRKDGTPIFGLMTTYRMTWATIAPDDASAIAKYIKSIKPIKHKVKANKFTPPQPTPSHMKGGGSGGGHKHGSGMGGGGGGGGKGGGKN